MRRLGNKKGSFTNRTYYEGDNGELIAEVKHDWKLADSIAAACQEEAGLFRKFNGDDLRKVASMPVDVALALISMAENSGALPKGKWVGDPQVDEFLFSVMNGTCNYKFLGSDSFSSFKTVPSTYRT